MPLGDPLAVSGEIADLIDLKVVLPPGALRPQRLLQHVAMTDGIELQAVHGTQYPLAAHGGDGVSQLVAGGQGIRMGADRTAERNGGQCPGKRDRMSGCHFWPLTVAQCERMNQEIILIDESRGHEAAGESDTPNGR